MRYRFISSHGVKRHPVNSNRELQFKQFRAILLPYSECGKEANRARYDRTTRRILHTRASGENAPTCTGKCSEVGSSGEDTSSQSWWLVAVQQRRNCTVFRDSEERLLQQEQGKLTLPAAAKTEQSSSDWNPMEGYSVRHRCLHIIVQCYTPLCNEWFGSVYPKGSAMIPTDTIYTYSHARDRVKRVFVHCARPLCRVCGIPSSKLAYGYGISLCSEHFAEIEEAIAAGLLGRLEEQYAGKGVAG